MKQLNFLEYLHNEGITSNVTARDLLLSNKFVIIANTNGHNYNRFLSEEDNYLRFNNPHMGVSIAGENVTEGVLTPRYRGNTLSLRDIRLVPHEISKSTILTDIESTQKKMRELDEDLKELTEKLDFLVESNSDSLVEEDFNKWKKEKITKSLKTITSSIAVIKV